MLTLTAPPIVTTKDEAALHWYALALDNLVSTLQRNPWAGDNLHIGPHAAILAQARADRDAAHAAYAAARDSLNAWVRPL